MDGFKSLRPLVLSLTSPKGLQKLQKDRGILAEKIIEVVNNFGSELFPDFDSAALREEFDVLDEEEEDRKTSELKRRKMLKKQKLKGKRKTCHPSVIKMTTMTFTNTIKIQMAFHWSTVTTPSLISRYSPLPSNVNQRYLWLQHPLRLPRHQNSKLKTKSWKKRRGWLARSHKLS